MKTYFELKEKHCIKVYTVTSWDCPSCGVENIISNNTTYIPTIYDRTCKYCNRKFEIKFKRGYKDRDPYYYLEEVKETPIASENTLF